MESKQDMVNAARELGRLSADVGDSYDFLEAFIAGYAESMAETSRNTSSLRHELVKLTDLKSAVETLLAWRVDDAREAHESWDWIAEALDVTRQTVWRKYRKIADPSD